MRFREKFRVWAESPDTRGNDTSGGPIRPNQAVRPIRATPERATSASIHGAGNADSICTARAPASSTTAVAGRKTSTSRNRIRQNSLSSDRVGGEGWGEGDAPGIGQAYPKFATPPPHPALSPKQAWGRGENMRSTRSRNAIFRLLRFTPALRANGPSYACSRNPPSCNSSTRSMRRASALSCVTRTRLVPISRLSSSINA